MSIHLSPLSIRNKKHSSIDVGTTGELYRILILFAVLETINEQYFRFILDTMQLASEYIIHSTSNDGLQSQNDNNDFIEENGKINSANPNKNITKQFFKQHQLQIPSRASSGASSSGFKTNTNSNLKSINNNSTNSSTFRETKTNDENQSGQETDSVPNTSVSNNRNIVIQYQNNLPNMNKFTNKIPQKHDSTSNVSRETNSNSTSSISQNSNSTTIISPSLEHMSSKHAKPQNLELFLLENSLTESELWQFQIKDFSANNKNNSDIPDGKTILEQLNLLKNEAEIKRQETIYEFIKTERSHLKNMLLINDVWKFGLKNNKSLRHVKIDKLLPGVEKLLFQSKIFLNELHERQLKQYPIINNIGDVLANHWQEHEKEITKNFSQFCSNHGDALLYYKELINNDKKFSNFIAEIRAKNITQRKDLPDCLNIAMQRITKYGIMVNKIKERTLHTNKASEILDLEAAIDCIEIIAERVDQEVKFVNKGRRLAFICKKFDSSKAVKTVGRKTSFGKSDLSFDKRRLFWGLFESHFLNFYS